jgi:hypothetical protein
MENKQICTENIIIYKYINGKRNTLKETAVNRLEVRKINGIYNVLN